MQSASLELIYTYLFIIYLDYVLRTLIDQIKQNGLMLKKARSRWYHTESITDADYADYLVLLANIQAQAKSLLHSQEQIAVGIGLHMNANKTEDISTLNRRLLKFIDKFITKQRCGLLLIGNWSYRFDVRGAFNKFPDHFFAQAFKIVVDSWKFSILWLYILWDDWPIFMISGSNEQLQH